MKTLRDLREKRGLTLEQVAEALDSKNQYISNYELGKRRPDYDMLIKFADFYGVTVDYLLGREPKVKPTLDAEDGLDDEKRAFVGKLKSMDSDTVEALNKLADTIIAKREK